MSQPIVGMVTLQQIGRRGAFVSAILLSGLSSIFEAFLHDGRVISLLLQSVVRTFHQRKIMTFILEVSGNTFLQGGLGGCLAYLTGQATRATRL